MYEDSGIHCTQLSSCWATLGATKVLQRHTLDSQTDAPGPTTSFYETTSLAPGFGLSTRRSDTKVQLHEAQAADKSPSRVWWALQQRSECNALQQHCKLSKRMTRRTRVHTHFKNNIQDTSPFASQGSEHDATLFTRYQPSPSTTCMSVLLLCGRVPQSTQIRKPQE